MKTKIEKIIYPGKSLIRGQKVILTDEGLPGETVHVDIVKEKSNLDEAVTTQIVEPSSNRVQPRCSHYKICSNYQYIDYPTQVNIKKQQLEEIFSRTVVPGMKINFIESKKPWEYRNKANFLVKKTDKGLSLAYNKPNDPLSFEPIESCSLINTKLQTIATQAIDILNTNKIDCVNNITLRSVSSGATMLILHSSVSAGADWEKIFSPLIKKHDTSIIHELNNTLTTIHGENTLHEKAGNAHFTFGPLSFFQVNHGMLELLIKDLSKLLPIDENSIVADLYCGIGTFGITLAKKAAKLILVETALENTAFMQNNIQNNKLKNAQTYFGDTDRWLAKLKDQNIDIALIDPPRSGLGKDACKELLRIRPKNIAYVSCDPMTLKRDLEQLKSRYDIKSICGYDFFPQTGHIEALAILQLR